MNGEELLAAFEAAPAEVAETPAEFEFVTLPPAISFATREVPPPGALYISPNDTLLVQAWNVVAGAGLTITLRILLPDGSLQRTERRFITAAGVLYNSVTYYLPESFLLALVVTPDGGIGAGACYVRVTLMAAAPPSYPAAQGLIAGYAVAGSFLAWPYPRFVGPVEGPGRLRLITGTDPAAGASIIETVPAGVRWKLISVFCGFSTDATVANRAVLMWFQDGGGIWLYVAPVVNQAASLTYVYNWAIGLLSTATVLGACVQTNLPDQLFLVAGMQFCVVSPLGVAGDNFTAPRYLVEEWVEP